jgi:hypothetical protein
MGLYPTSCGVSLITIHPYDTVPVSNGSAPLLNIFRSLQNNRISGQIPPEIGKLTNLNALDLSGNQFVGDIPSSLGQLIRLNYL